MDMIYTLFIVTYDFVKLCCMSKYLFFLMFAFVLSEYFFYIVLHFNSIIKSALLAYNGIIIEIFFYYVLKKTGVVSNEDGCRSMNGTCHVASCEN